MAKSGDFEAAASPAASANCYYGSTCYFESSNWLINRLEEVAGFRVIGSWIPEATGCTLLIRYIRENFKIATFSRLSSM